MTVEFKLFVEFTGTWAGLPYLLWLIACIRDVFMKIHEDTKICIKNTLNFYGMITFWIWVRKHSGQRKYNKKNQMDCSEFHAKHNKNKMSLDAREKNRWQNYAIWRIPYLKWIQYGDCTVYIRTSVASTKNGHWILSKNRLFSYSTIIFSSFFRVKYEIAFIFQNMELLLGRRFKEYIHLSLWHV